VSASTLRRRIEAQGFRGLDDAYLAEVGPWLRWSPALCAAWMAAATIGASPPALWTLAVIAGLGAVLPAHPFDFLYNGAARRLTGTRPLPRHGPQRRFACGMAAAWLAGTGLAFHEGAMVLGYALGASLTAVATLVAVTNFCLPSLVYNTLFERHRAPRPAAARGTGA
jgi:hypothetical protein